MEVKSDQKGFTLIEILAAMAVGGMLLSGLVVATFQTFGINKQSTTQITALEDIKIVAHHLSRDIRTSSATTLADLAEGQSNLGLTWTTWYKEKTVPDTGELIIDPETGEPMEDLVSYGIDHYCECTLLEEEGKVQLQYWEWDCDPLVEEEGVCDQEENWWVSLEPIRTNTVGRYISNIEFSRDGSIITAAITSSPDGKAETAETRTYHFYVRLKEELVQ